MEAAHVNSTLMREQDTFFKSSILNMEHYCRYSQLTGLSQQSFYNSETRLELQQKEMFRKRSLIPKFSSNKYLNKL